MKTKMFILFCLSFVIGNDTFAQLDSLAFIYVEKYDSTGFFYFKNETLEPGDIFNIYTQQTADLLNTWVLKKDQVDSFVGMRHYRYQQYFRQLRVEGCLYTEHEKDSFIVFANGRTVHIANDLAYQPDLIEEAACKNCLIIYQVIHLLGCILN